MIYLVKMGDFPVRYVTFPDSIASTPGILQKIHVFCGHPAIGIHWGDDRPTCHQKVAQELGLLETRKPLNPCRKSWGFLNGVGPHFVSHIYQAVLMKNICLS
jgi:hypothetical protein